MVSLRHRLRPSQPSTATVEDAHLVALARTDLEAFATLYDRHFAGIYGYCYRRLGSAERAEDAAQQVFTQALASLPRYREMGRFRSWLYAVAHHVIGEQLSGDYANAPIDVIDDVPDPGGSPEEQALGSLERAALLKAIEHLPPDQRLVIELRVAGLKGREIAEELGRSHEAVRMLQHRALARLASVLAAPGQPRGGEHGA